MKRSPAKSYLALAAMLVLLSPPTLAVSRPEPGAQTRPITIEKVQEIIADSGKVVSPHGIEENRLLPINGIMQWISIRGRDLRNPILLVLHGGPGSPEMPAAWTFQSPWEDYFTVVEWSQRGTGKTYAANTEAAMAPGMNIDDMADDAAALIQYLRARFHKHKIFLMAHSWGTVLGVTVAQRHPDWLYAYIGVGQIVNFRKNEEAGYQFALSQAKAHHDTQAVKELEDIAPYPGKLPTIAQVGVRSKWEMYYGGLAWGRRNFDFSSNTWKLSPVYNKTDLEAIDAGSLFSLEHLLPALMDVNFDHTTKFACPIIQFVGAHDYTTPYELTQRWFETIHAPAKKLVVFADSAHMIMQEQPGRFLVHLVTDARPYAVKAGDTAPTEVSRR